MVIITHLFVHYTIDNSLLYWGWPLCTRTTYRFLEHYEKFPRLLRAIQKYTPFFKNGLDQPRGEASFINPIYKAALGCGYISVIDGTHKVLTWGDNYAVRLLSLMALCNLKIYIIGLTRDRR